MSPLATAESLSLATKSEIEIEARLKRDDSAPMDTAVGANLKDAAADTTVQTA